LNEAYPPSKLRTIGGIILISAGGWLLLTILRAIIEWVVKPLLMNEVILMQGNGNFGFEEFFLLFRYHRYIFIVAKLIAHAKF
jgi:hypothetical protein